MHKKFDKSKAMMLRRVRTRLAQKRDKRNDSRSAEAWFGSRRILWCPIGRKGVSIH